MFGVCDLELARLTAPPLIQQVVEDWDMPRPIGFGNPITVDPPPLYWWVKRLPHHDFVGFCVWYDKDTDHAYDFTGFGYWLPKIGGGMPGYTWCRRHFHIDVALGRREPIYSTAGKHSMSVRPPESRSERLSEIKAWDVSEATNLASEAFLERSGGLQEQMGATAQLPQNWVDLDVRNYVNRFRRRCRMEYGIGETRGLLFHRPDVVLDILMKIGNVTVFK